MTENLPFNIVITYLVFALFTAQQKFCVRELVGTNNWYFLCLGFFSFFSSVFGIGFLIYYAIEVSWLASIGLFALGLFVYVPYAFFHSSIEKILPLQIWGGLSFVVIPICSATLLYQTPDSVLFEFNQRGVVNQSDFPEVSEENAKVEFQYDLVFTYLKKNQSISYTYRERINCRPESLDFNITGIIFLDENKNPLGVFNPKKKAKFSSKSENFRVFQGIVLSDNTSQSLTLSNLENAVGVSELFSVTKLN